MITIASWYLAALLVASHRVDALLTIVFGALDFVQVIVHMALATFFIGTGASRFLFAG